MPPSKHVNCSQILTSSSVSLAALQFRIFSLYSSMYCRDSGGRASKSSWLFDPLPRPPWHAHPLLAVSAQISATPRDNLFKGVPILGPSSLRICHSNYTCHFNCTCNCDVLLHYRAGEVNCRRTSTKLGLNMLYRPSTVVLPQP